MGESKLAAKGLKKLISNWPGDPVSNEVLNVANSHELLAIAPKSDLSIVLPSIVTVTIPPERLLIYLGSVGK